ncbi:FPPS synthase, partial [Hypocryptadius cinnamomeus]|nr:FPPS synthase [Hypocryptadius cinnamomeus]
LQTGYQTELGQTLDLITAPVSQVDLSRFSEQRYEGQGHNLVLSQPGAAFWGALQSLPCRGWHWAGFWGALQSLPCRGWPFWGALQFFIKDHSNKERMPRELGWALTHSRVFPQENYGCKEPQKVAKVKELYDALGMPAAFREYEESSYRRLQELIGKRARRLPRDIFLDLAQKIYKRQK